MDLTNDFFKNINHNIFYNSIDVDADKCMICGLPYDENNRVTLDCGHVYHNECVNLIIKKSPLFACPYCKNYQAKFNIIKKCKYVTKNGKICTNKCITDVGICKFHNKYLKNNVCFGIVKSGKNKGKRCNFTPIDNNFFCKIHYKCCKND